MTGSFWCQAISSLADSLTSTVESDFIRKISAFWSDGNDFIRFLRPPSWAVRIPDKPSAEVQGRQAQRRDVDSDQGTNPSSVKTIIRKINKARNSCTDVVICYVLNEEKPRGIGGRAYCLCELARAEYSISFVCSANPLSLMTRSQPSICKFQRARN